MLVLVIGDIVGQPGRKAVHEGLPLLRQQYKLDMVIVNAENAAGGFGLHVLRSAQQREEQQRRDQLQRDLAADRADYEDQLYREGDLRGVHGRYPPE